MPVEVRCCDQIQGMVVLDTLILAKRFPADEKINTTSLLLLYPTSVQGFIKPLSDTSFENIFFHLVDCFFHFVDSLLCCAEAF